MTKKFEWLVVGEITSAHGINGQLKVRSLSDFQERFTKSGTRWLQKGKEKPVKFELIKGFKKPGKETFIITLEEIKNRAQAEQLIKQKILVRNSDIPKLEHDEFHINELLNLKVKLSINKKLILIGEVTDLITENNTLLKIYLFDKNKKILVPFVKEIVPIVDKENKYIIINPPKGLFDL
tara:strand:- start:146 stop:685 length:540 start_codon:yes stop_codon:yes gene_type:complete